MNFWSLLALIVALLVCRTQVVHASTSPGGSYEGEQRRETVDSLLRSLFESESKGPRLSAHTAGSAQARRDALLQARRDSLMQAPLAHERAPISHSFHLLKVTGAKATKEPGEVLQGQYPKKYEYIDNLRKQFS